MFAWLRDRRKETPKNTADRIHRQYRLNLYINLEIIILCTLMLAVYSLAKMWAMVTMIFISYLFAVINLMVLIRTKNTHISGYVSTFIIFASVSGANYIVGGTATPYSIWFYLIPLIAVALIGWSSLGLFSLLSLITIVGFGWIPFHPVYQLHASKLMIIQWASHIVAFVVMVTTLNSLMRENMRYETVLRDQNYLLKTEKDKFQHLSRYDQLTNMPNRHYFMQHLNETLNNLKPNQSITILFMDLDHFKQINGHFGHNAGDHLLRKTAKDLKKCFRSQDFIARFGGDEFTAVVVHEKGQTIAQEIANRIQTDFSCPKGLHDAVNCTSISVGLANYPADAKTVTQLIKIADLAMYKKKHKMS